MIIWRQSRTLRACLFGVLLAALAGCDSGDDATPASTLAKTSTSTPDTMATSTFDTKQTTTVVAETTIPNEPARGMVTVVPGQDKTPPDTAGGLALPVNTTASPSTQPVVPAPAPESPPPASPAVTNVPLAAPQVRAARFTEVAPDTIGGATYQSSETLYYDLGNLAASTGGDLSTFSDDKIFITPVIKVGCAIRRRHSTR